MLTRAAVVCAGIMSGMLVVGPAAADQRVAVNPEVAEPGESVTVSGGCNKNTDSQVDIRSPALSPDDDTLGDNGRFSISSVVDAVDPGTYKVTVECVPSGTTLTGTVTVRAAKHTEPSGWAATGGGGMRGTTTALPAAPWESPWSAAGLALILGAVGIGGTALVRSARGRG